MTHWHFISAVIVASLFVVSSTTAQGTSDLQKVEPVKSIEL